MSGVIVATVMLMLVGLGYFIGKNKWSKFLLFVQLLISMYIAFAVISWQKMGEPPMLDITATFLLLVGPLLIGIAVGNIFNKDTARKPK